MLHPHGDALACVLEAVELCTRKVLLKDRLPEAFDLAQRLRMVRLRTDVLHLVLLKLGLEAGLATPVRVLTPVVRQHLLGDAVFRTGLPIDFKHMLRGLGSIQA